MNRRKGKQILCAALCAMWVLGSAARDVWAEESAHGPRLEGLLRLDAASYRLGAYDPKNPHVNGVTALLRLDGRMPLGSVWAVKARGEATTNLRGDAVESALTCRRLYAEGSLLSGIVQMGKIGVFDSENLTNGGLIMDTEIMGARFSIGEKWRVALAGGRIDNDDYDLTRTTTIFRTNSDYLSLQLSGNPAGRLRVAGGFHNVHNNAKGLRLPNGALYSPGGKGFFESGGKANNGVWHAGFDYDLSARWTVGAIYAGSTARIMPQAQRYAGESVDEERSYSVQLTYGGAGSPAPGDCAAWIAYRQAGRLSSLHPTYDGVGFGERGFEAGVAYAPRKDTLLRVVYFHGEKISKVNAAGEAHPMIEKIFARVEFLL